MQLFYVLEQNNNECIREPGVVVETAACHAGTHGLVPRSGIRVSKKHLKKSHPMIQYCEECLGD